MRPRGRFGRLRYLRTIGFERTKTQRYRAKYGNRFWFGGPLIYLMVLATAWIMLGDNLAAFWPVLLIISVPALLVLLLLVPIVMSAIRGRQQ